VKVATAASRRGASRTRTRLLTAWGRATVVLALVLVADQLTKQAVRDGIAPGDVHHVIPGVTLVHDTNAGVAFGILPGDQGVVVALIALALLALLVYFARNATRPWAWLPTGLLIGGALGNIVDRAVHGSVTDFIKLPYWPPFNVADSAITIGVVALLLVIEGPRVRGAQQRGG
jgi:signal peptidase II